MTRRRILILDRDGAARYRDAEGRFQPSAQFHHVSVITKSAHEAGFADIRGLDLHIADTDRDLNGLMAIADALHARHPFDGVVALSERHILPAAEFRVRHKIAGRRPDAAFALRDKLTMAHQVQAAGIPVPEQVCLAETHRVRDLLARHGRIVVKPRDGMGSAGVHVVETRRELEERIEVAGNRAKDQLAAQYLENREFHVEAVTVGDRVVFAECFEYIGHPLRFRDLATRRGVTVRDDTLAARILALNASALEAVALRNGVSHLECFLTPDGQLYFGEVAGRPGGSGISECVSGLWGIDTGACGALLEVGLPVELKPEARFPAGGWIAIYPRAGRLQEVSPLSVFTDDWVTHAEILCQPGQQLVAPIMSGASIARFSVGGDTPGHVRERLEEISQRFTFHVAQGAEELAEAHAS
ncbi:acetyl-CoA carboxylase biotin carboxylase subunit family protein [Stappia sp. ES.058]|uniref:ATP-grasp domain-containing protein n=1 Tax=Stappia sp. ES.058 TaxID=1881061 RepID=UPI00087CE28A|nr:ATP-grasp domain-containing protein [Stappia sp. ES.058]SDU44253.1 ATP-grasp domain-containing protein [Stappia sp. ES.058]